MAGTALAAAGLPAEAELAAFARFAARRLATDARRMGELRAASRRAGPGTTFLDHRDYVPGDDLRHLSGPATLRHGRPVVRQFEMQRRADWVICLDVSSSMATHGAAKYHLGRQLCLGLAYTLLYLGHRVALLAYGARVEDAVPAGRGRIQYERLHRLLARQRCAPQAVGTNLAACTTPLAGAEVCIVLSDFLGDDAARAALLRLARRTTTVRALELVHPAEFPPATDDREFIDAESGERLYVEGSAASEAARRAALARAARDLARACLRARIAHSAAPVGERWQAALLRHLERPTPG